LRQTIKRRLYAKVREIKDELRKRMHDSIQEVGKWLKTVVMGHYMYFGVPGNCRAMNTFRHLIGQRWFQSLERRSQKGRITWKKKGELLSTWLPRARVCHKYPSERFGVIT
jgi:hypothetical protein